MREKQRPTSGVISDGKAALESPFRGSVVGDPGFQVTQFCDYVVAHPGVCVGQTEINAGLPSVFGTWLMWQRVGRRAVELALQGRLMEVQEARQLGFIQEVVGAGQVLDAALQAAHRLAQQPPVAYSYSKAAIRQFDQEGYINAMRMAMEAYQRAFDSGAPQRAIAQFFERRRARAASSSA